MVISQLVGGIGNQMFQYAVARKISLKHNIEFKIDIREFEKYKVANYNINNFNIIENIFNDDKNKMIILKEKDGEYDFKPNILEIYEKDIYLIGYWQSEKYFSDIRDILLKDFELKNKTDEINTQWENKIKNDCNSVSVHMRRHHPEYKNFYFCSEKYFNTAFEIIEKKIKTPEFYVFSESEEMEWCHKNIKYKDYKINFLGFNDNSPWCDIYLMSKCKHNIISNSSFSWWGAWLNNNKNKNVISPINWYNDGTSTKDLIPEKWVRI